MKSRIIRCAFFSMKEIQTKENNSLSLVHTRKQNDDDCVYNEGKKPIQSINKTI